MKVFNKRTINKILGKTTIDKFPDAPGAFGMAKYKQEKEVTREEIIKNLITEIEQKITEKICDNLGNNLTSLDEKYVYINTYSEFREKSVLESVKDHFISKKYSVALLNTAGFKDINVLIITWQGNDENLLKDTN